MEAVIFFVCAAAVLIGALGVIAGRNPVHSALFLLLTLVSVAVLYLQQHAALVAAIQIVVYASAIVVLFLFVITLLGVDKHEAPDDAHPVQRVAAIVLGVLALVGILVLVHGNRWVTGAHSTRGALGTARVGQRRDARQEPVHRLRLGVRDHGGAARDRGRRQRGARPPQRPPSRGRRADAPPGERTPV